jgi:hypothetical protein
MEAAMLLDPCKLLIMHEHPIDAAAFPSASKVSVKERFAPIYHERSADFQIPPGCLAAFICDIDHGFFTAFSFDTKGQ